MTIFIFQLADTNSYSYLVSKTGFKRIRLGTVNSLIRATIKTFLETKFKMVLKS